jgi:NADPH:quinone reductase-like Zn-dependent oxidoreductase
MKAAVCSKYGSPEMVRIKDVLIPTLNDDEILVKVYAATVNRTDCGILRGKPNISRLFTGLFKPRTTIMGTDFAGQIEAVRQKVKSFYVGDKVMGFGGMAGACSHAQYLTFPASKGVIAIPGNLTYDQAAACLEGAFYASVGMKKLKPKPGQKALVYGATGAIGSSIVQFLKYYGVYVTAVCGGENSELVASLGANKIIDYKTEDFTKDPERYDFVFDAVGKTSFSKCKRLLTKKGIFSWSDGLHNILLSMLTPLFGGKKVVFFPPTDIKGGLNFIKEVIEKGSFKPIIDRKYPIEKIVEAYTYVELGQKVGNVIITMDA